MSRFDIDRARNRIDLFFEEKPEEKVREKLKSNGWHWHNQRKCWYNIWNDTNEKFANKLSGKKPQRQKGDVIKSEFYKNSHEEKCEKGIYRINEIINSLKKSRGNKKIHNTLKKYGIKLDEFDMNMYQNKSNEKFSFSYYDEYSIRYAFGFSSDNLEEGEFSISFYGGKAGEIQYEIKDTHEVLDLAINVIKYQQKISILNNKRKSIQDIEGTSSLSNFWVNEIFQYKKLYPHIYISEVELHNDCIHMRTYEEGKEIIRKLYAS